MKRENELKQLGELRLKTLEHIIAQKHQTVSDLQKEVKQFQQQNQELKLHVDEKMSIVTDYEDKFEKLKMILHQKEVMLSDLRAQLDTKDDHVKNKDSKVEVL